jgi:Ca2+-binding EF-hand superfamily protein
VVIFGAFCTAPQIRQMMQETDLDGDGVISFEEFVSMMQDYRTGLRRYWTLHK